MIRSGCSPRISSTTRAPPAARCGRGRDGARRTATPRSRSCTARRRGLPRRPLARARSARSPSGRGCLRCGRPSRVRRTRRGPPRRPRSSRRRRRARSRPRARPSAPSSRSAATPSADHAGREPAPAGVDHRHRAAAGDRDRQAVGGHHHRRPTPRVAVAWPSDRRRLLAVAGRARPPRATHRAVDLPDVGERQRPAAPRSACGFGSPWRGRRRSVAPG